MFGAYNRKFPDARTPNDWICSDPEVVAKYTADPLCGQDATIGLTREMLRGIRMIQRPANLQRMDKALPVFFIAGRSDPVGNMGRGVEKTAAAFRAAGMQDVACKLYDGRHEILNEKNRQLVYDDVLAFYERHLD
jgi:alpha-beta hydrolase superfamily lysophospholipase